MNRTSALSAVLAGACWASLVAAQGVTVRAPPAPAASAASASAPAVTRGARPAESPAVRAAQTAATPGDLRPENPVVPQIAVPLRRARDAAGPVAAGSAAADAIDDSAARCRAATTERERAACVRSGHLPIAPPKR